MRTDWGSPGAEYQGNGIELVSTDPLLGRLQLFSGHDEIVELVLDRATAEQLVSSLMDFLSYGQGGDAPSFSAER